MVKLNNISFQENNTKIVYDYSVSKAISGYFNEKNPFYVCYDKCIENTPLSIAVIPFLSNIIPISWFVGFDVYIDEIDETFLNSLKILKEQFQKHYPEKALKGELHYNTIVKNSFHGEESILLFSGGLDSFESLTRNFSHTPHLVSIHGADVEISDQVRWNQFKKFNKEEAIVNDSKTTYVESNLRLFYTYKVDLLTKTISWWGEIQHGMALLGVLAPLTNILNVNQIFIASSNTSEVDFSWGSRPEIDENMKWADLKVIHDGYHLRRTEKIENVIKFSEKNQQNINLRVCYSELRNGANCNVCHKCQRTMLGIILAGSNPNNYGLEIPKDFYRLLLSNFESQTVLSEGLKYEWKCLQDKANEALNNDSFFIINNKEDEQNSLKLFVEKDLNSIGNSNDDKLLVKKRKKLIYINKYPILYKVYQKLK